MRVSVLTVLILVLTVCVPVAARAQASIAGVVTDSSGAVLPGVTVEARSPALIEQVRTAITDGTGQFRIVDLRPGVYSVTFSLPGFATVRREGVELTGAFTATVNAELRVGDLQETVTVTGATPTVDVQSARRQQTIQSEALTALPSNRAPNSIVGLVPGVTVSGNQNVVTNPGPMLLFSIHGGPLNEGRLQVDGLNVGASLNGGGVSGYSADVGNAQEVTFTTSGGLAEVEVGGPHMNVVPRTGGNTISGSFFAAGSNDAMQSDNFTRQLRDAGLSVPAEQLALWDVNGSLGGPIWRDRLWYFGTVRNIGNVTSVPGMFHNRNAGDPTKWTYEPDLDRQAENDGKWQSYALRLTAQVTPRNKVNLFWDEQIQCSQCDSTGSATVSPEAAGFSFQEPQRVQQVSWTSPATSRLLLEAGFGTYLVRWGTREPEGGNPTRDLIRVQEQAGRIPGLIYRSQDWTFHWIGAHTWRASVSYITGAHSMKFGYQGAHHEDDRNSFTNDHSLSYRLNNGVPNLLTMNGAPLHTRARTRYAAFYAQEQWTRGPLTLQGGLRYDRAWSYFPDQQIGPTRFIPTPLIFPETAGVDAFNDVTIRTGAAYDLFGDGRTALKVNFGKFLQPASNADRYTATNPTSRVATSTTRSWNDADADFVADCDLLDPGGNGECGPWDNRNFGREVFSTTYDSALLEGWGVRPWDWQFGISVQRELFPRVSVELGYHRRWWGNFDVTDNRAVGPEDFDVFSLTAPLDPRLPDGGGYVITDVYDVDPERFGQIDNFRTAAENFGNQIENWHGVDLTIDARLPGQLTVQGGLSTGRKRTDTCDVVPKIDNPSRRFCEVTEPFRTQFKGLASIVVPRVEVQASATFRSTPGSSLAANWVVPNALVAPSLGRDLAGGASVTVVNLVPPATVFGDRINQLDLRLAKLLRFGRTRTSVGVDLFNVLNASTVLAYNQSYGPRWLTPTSVLSARFARVSAQIDF